MTPAPTRAVSFLPAATEIVAALGALDRLAGVSHECDFPPEVRALPRVTRSAIPEHASPAEVDAAVRALVATAASLFAVDDAVVGQLAPDVLLTQAVCDVCAVSERDVCGVAERLAATRGRAPRVVTLGGTSLGGVFADVERVAVALDVPERGRALVAALGDRLTTVGRALDASGAPRPRCAVVEWTAPVFLAGHWGPEMVRLAGGDDVLGVEGAHSAPVAVDRLAAADPDVVIVAPCGYGLARAAEEARALGADPAWAWLAGRAVWALDANAYLSRPGPRLVDGVELLAAILHPAVFGDADPRRAERIG